MTQNQNLVAAAEAAGAAGAGPANQQAPRRRVVALNALPPNALPRRHLQLDMIPVSISDLAAWVQRRLQEGWQLIHFIRHPATIQALRAAGVPLPEQPNAALYTYQPGDILVIVTLRSPPRGQEVQQVNVSDLEFWVAAVI